MVRVAEQKNVLPEHLYHKPLIDPDELYKELVSYRIWWLLMYAMFNFPHNALKEGKIFFWKVTARFAKDPDHGIYPMVTSSSRLPHTGRRSVRALSV